MPYEVLEKIKSIPEKYAAEFSDYVDKFISKIEEPEETFEEEQARKQAAIQAMLDWAKAVHCRSTDDWTREEIHERGFGREHFF